MLTKLDAPAPGRPHCRAVQPRRKPLRAVLAAAEVPGGAHPLRHVHAPVAGAIHKGRDRREYCRCDLRGQRAAHHHSSPVRLAGLGPRVRGLIAKYPARELLGLNDGDIDSITDLVSTRFIVERF